MIARILSAYRNHQARKRLAEIVAQTRASDKHQDFLKRRAAALKGHALKRERTHG